jgi:hypothetical protein
VLVQPLCRRSHEQGEVHCQCSACATAPQTSVSVELVGRNVNFLELSRRNSIGRSGERARPRARLRESDDIAYRCSAGKDHDEPVQTERDPAMGRRAVGECVEQEAEASRRPPRNRCPSAQEPLLKLAVVHAECASADLEPVDDQIVREGERAAGVDSSRSRCSSKGRVNGWCTAVHRSSSSSHFSSGKSTTHRGWNPSESSPSDSPRCAGSARRGPRWRGRERRRP